jgi:hypothetical protein
VKGPTSSTVCPTNVSGGAEGTGCEFRPGRDDYFTIVAQDAGNSRSYPAPYTFRVDRDCRDDDHSRCRLTPSNSTSGPLSYGLDVDWIKLASLTAGRSYVATLTPQAPVFFGVVTSSGAAAGPKVPVAGGTTQSITFKAMGATLFLKVEGSEAQNRGGPWKVSLR